MLRIRRRPSPRPRRSRRPRGAGGERGRGRPGGVGGFGGAVGVGGRGDPCAAALGYRLAVPGDGPLGGPRPGEPLQHALPAGRAEPGPQGGVAQQPAEARGECARVARRHGQAGVPVAPGDLGDRPAGRGEQRRAGGHGLGGRQGEALVQRRHAGDLGRTHQVDEFGVGDALDELDGPFEAVPLDRLGDRPLLGALADDDEVGVRVLGAHLRQRLDEEDQALERDVRAGRRHDPARHDGHGRVRREQVGVGADVDDVDAVVADAEVVGDLLPGGAGDGEHGRQPARHALLHPGERVPAAHREASPSSLGGVQLQLPVDGDGVVDGGDQRCADVAQQSVAQGLVVVHDVELPAAGTQMAAGAQGERQRFGEAAGPHRRHFEGVDPVPVLAPSGRAEGVRLAVEVEAGQFGEGEPVLAPRVEHGVGLGADHLDAVPEAGELPRQMPYVDALPPAERVPLIGEECDLERSLAVGSTVTPGPRLTGLSGHSGPPSACIVPRDYDGTLI